MFVNQLQAASIPVYNAQVPGEGPKSIAAALDFSQAASFTLQGESLLSHGYISMVQTLFVDTTGLAAPLVITIGGSGQVLIVKQNTQGYYPVLAANPFNFDFSCTNGNNAIARIQLLNFPVAPFQYPTV